MMFAKTIGEIIVCMIVKSIAKGIVCHAINKKCDTESLLMDKFGVHSIDEFMKMSKDEYDARMNQH